MNIILLGTAYPFRGGLATFNERLARQLQAEGHQVEVITSQHQHPHENSFDFLVTSLAKTRLKAGIKDYKRSFKEDGKSKLNEYFDKLNVEFTKQNININIEEK